MTCRGCRAQVCACPDPIYAGLTQPPASVVFPCGAPPLTGGASPCLAGDLVDQGARDRDAHGARGEVKGAAVHVPGISTTEGNVCVR